MKHKLTFRSEKGASPYSTFSSDSAQSCTHASASWHDCPAESASTMNCATALSVSPAGTGSAAHTSLSLGGFIRSTRVSPQLANDSADGTAHNSIRAFIVHYPLQSIVSRLSGLLAG